MMEARAESLEMGLGGVSGFEGARKKEGKLLVWRERGKDE